MYDDDECIFNDDIEAFLTDTPLYTNNTANGISLLWAPHPFNLKSGHIHRTIYISLVSNDVCK